MVVVTWLWADRRPTLATIGRPRRTMMSANRTCFIRTSSADRPDVVVQLHDPVGKVFDRTEMQRHLTMAPRDERYALANEDGHDADDEFVDGAFIQEGRDDVATAHHPDVLPFAAPQPLREGADVAGDEFDTGRRGCRRLSRKHVGGALRIARRTQFQAHFVRLPSQHRRVNGPHERAHPIEPLWSRAVREPIQIAVWPGDVAVGARREVDDDLAALACGTWHRNLAGCLSIFRAGGWQ